MNNLQRLIDLIDLKLAAFADAPASDYRASGKAARRIIEELIVSDHAVSPDNAGYEHSLKLGGFRTTCTSGWYGLLRNWQAAARKRLAKEATPEPAKLFVAYADRVGMINFCHRSMAPANTVVFAEDDDLDELRERVSHRAARADLSDALVVGLEPIADTPTWYQKLVAWHDASFQGDPIYLVGGAR